MKACVHGQSESLCAECQLAAAVKKATAVEPSPEFKREFWAEFEAEFGQKQPVHAAVAPGRKWGRRWWVSSIIATAAAAMLAVVIHNNQRSIEERELLGAMSIEGEAELLEEMELVADLEILESDDFDQVLSEEESEGSTT